MDQAAADAGNQCGENRVANCRGWRFYANRPAGHPLGRQPADPTVIAFENAARQAGLVVTRP